MNKITKTVVVASAVFTIGGGTALAQSPADAVYNPNQDVAGVVGSGTPTPQPTATAAPETSSGAPAETEETTTPAAEATPTATSTPSTQTQEAQPGDLPFTGFEAGFVALAGLALLGGGLAMRRAARDSS